VWFKYWSLRLLVSQLEGATKRVEVSGQRKNMGKHFARWGETFGGPPPKKHGYQPYIYGRYVRMGMRRSPIQFDFATPSAHPGVPSVYTS